MSNNINAVNAIWVSLLGRASVVTAPPKDQDTLFKEWQNRIEDLVVNEIYLLNYHQDLFAQVRDDAVERYPDRDFTWVSHYACLYAHGQALALRRLCERDPAVRSLYSLINAVGRDKEVLSHSVMQRWPASPIGHSPYRSISNPLAKVTSMSRR